MGAVVEDILHIKIVICLNLIIINIYLEKTTTKEQKKNAVTKRDIRFDIESIKG
jgi:hypothetical protein